MQDKKHFIAPEITIIEIEDEDILTESLSLSSLFFDVGEDGDGEVIEW